MDPVFILELPLALSPTMNVFSSMRPWQKKKLRESVDWEIDSTKDPYHDAGDGHVWNRWPKADCKGERRKVVVTRYSSSEPDEIACDCIGSKVAIDRLVQAGILAGDSRKHLEREAKWQKAKPCEGKLVIEVYELEAA